MTHTWAVPGLLLKLGLHLHSTLLFCKMAGAAELITCNCTWREDQKPVNDLQTSYDSTKWKTLITSLKILVKETNELISSFDLRHRNTCQNASLFHLNFLNGVKF